VARQRPGLVGGLRSVVDPEVHVVPDVQGLSLRMKRGGLTGLVGPNADGKRTTIEMLTGILTPTGGHARVAGLDPQRQRRELAATACLSRYWTPPSWPPSGTRSRVNWC